MKFSFLKTLLPLMFVSLVVAATFWAFSPALTPQPLRNMDKWFILLNPSPDQGPISWKKFQMAILDPDNHPPLPDSQTDIRLLAYISVGEAEAYRAYWPKAKGASWIVRENPHWPENYLVDVRAAEWQSVLLNQVIPEILARGFQGLFMDTLDTAVLLEEENPEAYGGAGESLVHLVGKIKKKFPQLILLSNNGLPLLARMGPYLDGALVEDLHGQIDFEKNGYKLVSAEERDPKIEILKRFSKPVFVIDYAPLGNSARRKKFWRAAKALGFKPYIAEKELSRIYPQFF